MIGSDILHYNILAKIGQGGMGIVYKAYDTKLRRTVALKFLTDSHTTSETDKARFLREARAASAINHPNVCTIFDLKDYNDEQFIVMEYIEGTSLKNIIKSEQQLPLEQVIDYAKQMAAGLAAAHDKGIIHRDIKSENIMLTPSGQIKIMDFGLARIKGASELTKSASTVGTVAYMSPEQLDGREVDFRSDIFSFGVVFYELLTGHLPFKGEHPSTMIHSILNGEPEPVEKFRNVPENISIVLNKILKKNSVDRYQSIDAIVQDLDQGYEITDLSISSLSSSKKSSLKKRQQEKNSLTLHMFAIIAMVLIVSAVILYQSDDKQSAEIQILSITSGPGKAEGVTFSPDGKKLAFHWIKEGEEKSRYDLYVHQIGTTDFVRLTSHPDFDLWPAWSPDGQYIAFSRWGDENLDNDGIYLIPFMGGTARKISSTVGLFLNWSPVDDLLAFSNGHEGSITMLSPGSGLLEQLTIPERNWADHYPVFSNDGQHVAFVRGETFGSGDIYVVSKNGGEPERITNDNAFIRGLVWSTNDKQLIFSSNRVGGQKLWRVTLKDKSVKLLAAGGQNSILPTLSKDGQHLAYSEITNDDWNVGRIKLPEKFTRVKIESVIKTGRSERAPALSCDGKRLAYSSDLSGFGEIWTCDVDGENRSQLTCMNAAAGSPQWSPAGEKIAFDNQAAGNGDIYVIAADGGSPIRLTFDPADDMQPSWSQDGEWIYFTSNRTKKDEIWKIKSAGGEPQQVTQFGGSTAFEAPDGMLYYFTQKDGKAGIWKRSISGGEEEFVQNTGPARLDWAAGPNGIYSHKWNDAQNEYIISYYDFKLKTLSKIASMEYIPELVFPAVPSDGKYYYLSIQPDMPQSNIIVVKNF